MRQAIARMLWLLVALSSPLSFAGCATPGVPLDELSEEPIALVYWSEADARRRKEILQDQGERPAGSARLGVASLERMTKYLSLGELPRPKRGLAEFPGHIVLLNPRSLEITAFPAAPPNARPLAWSPDHRRLLFSSQHLDGGTTQLYEFDLDRHEVRKLTRGPVFHLEGDYGPDGRLVVAWIRLGRDKAFAGLDVRQAGGGSPRRILDGVYASDVRWSPKGDVLLYVQADNRPRRLATQRDISEVVAQSPVAGAEKDVVTRGREPVFSPDGAWVVFAGQTAAGWKLRRMRPDGSARSPLGGSAREERRPAVSPDGRHVAYVSQDNGIDRLYLRRMDGSGDRILLGDGAVAFPVW